MKRLVLFALLASVLAGPAAAQNPNVPVWTLDPTPSLTIGQVDGPEEYVLANPIRGLVLNDGTVVIRDSARGYFELRYYDAQGTHLATVSRWGRGPFEFQLPRGLFRLPGDSVLVVGEDGVYGVFGPRGERVRDGRIGGPLGVLPSSTPTFLLNPEMLGVQIRGLVGATVQTGAFRNSYAFVLQTLEGVIDTLAVLAADSHYVERAGNRILGSELPFTPTATSAGGAGMYWIGRTDRPEVFGYDADGRLRTTIHLEVAPRPVTRADRARWRDENLSNASDFLRRAADRLGFPDTFPLWSNLQVDRDGNVWVRRYEVPWAEGPQYWDISLRPARSSPRPHSHETWTSGARPRSAVHT